MIVELIYDGDCPNVRDARSQLIKAFAQTGVLPRWKEWERSSPESPDYASAYGSPTILVNGKDIAGVVAQPGTMACRVYSDGRGNLSRTPALEAICLALRGATPKQKQSAGRWRSVAASLPAFGTALLPKLTCPLCFPAYAAILSAFGIEFVNYTPYLLPLTAVFLAVAITVLALQARRARNIVPLALGVGASLIVLFGKFSFESDWLTTGGVVLLVAAVVLGNRSKLAATVPCAACTGGEADPQVNAH